LFKCACHERSIGTSSLLVTEAEEKFKLVLAIEKFKGKTKSIALVLAFSLTTILACAGYFWLALFIFSALVVLAVVDFFPKWDRLGTLNWVQNWQKRF